MLPDQEPYGKKNYTFHIQSAEDFYNQLREQHRQDAAREEAIDVSDLSLARSMLASIGVECRE